MRNIQTAKQLGDFIVDQRKQAGLTQMQLSVKAGVSRSWLAGLETGDRPRAEFSKILQLLKALEVSATIGFSNQTSQPDNQANSEWQEVLDTFNDPFVKAQLDALKPVSTINLEKNG